AVYAEGIGDILRPRRTAAHRFHDRSERLSKPLKLLVELARKVRWCRLNSSSLDARLTHPSEIEDTPCRNEFKNNFRNSEGSCRGDASAPTMHAKILRDPV